MIVGALLALYIFHPVVWSIRATSRSKRPEPTLAAYPSPSDPCHRPASMTSAKKTKDTEPVIIAAPRVQARLDAPAHGPRVRRHSSALPAPFRPTGARVVLELERQVDLCARQRCRHASMMRHFAARDVEPCHGPRRGEDRYPFHTEAGPAVVAAFDRQHDAALSM